MTYRRQEKRSTEAPMDFEFTSPNRELPLDSPFRRGIEAASKRSRSDMESSTSMNTAQAQDSFSFGATATNVPFLFNVPPIPSPQPVDCPDVQMMDSTPPRPQEDARPVAMGGVKRVRRRRERDSALQLVSKSRTYQDASDESMSDTENPHSRTLQSPGSHISNHYTLNIPPQPPQRSPLPHTLLGYTQFIYNTGLTLLLLYLAINFVWTIERDLDKRIKEYQLEFSQEIAACKVSYLANQCHSPLPGLVAQCAEWETCMTRDPSLSGRARIGAELLAEVINSFVEPISWKTMLFSLSSVVILTALVNSMISLFRERQNHAYQNITPANYPQLTVPPSWWPEEQDSGQIPARRRKMLTGEAFKVK